MSSFEKVSSELVKRFPFYGAGVGAEIAKALNRVTDPNDREGWFRDIEKAIKFVDGMDKKLGTGKEIVDADPLAIIKVLSELRPSKAAPIDKATVLVGVMVSRLHLRRSPFAMPDPTQMDVIIDYLEQIGGRPANPATPESPARKAIRPLFDKALSSEVEALMRKTLQISEINRGGGGPSSQPEDELRPAFLHMVMEAVKDPRAVEIRGSDFLARMRHATDQYMENPTVENRCKIETFNEEADSIYAPLASAYGHNTLRDKIRDQQFWMMNPDRYREVRDMIVEAARAVAPAGKEGFITGLQDGLRIVIPPLEDAVREIIPKEFEGNVRVIGDIKKPLSTGKKIDSKGRADDVVRVRVEVAVPALAHLSPKANWIAKRLPSDNEIFDAEGAACTKILAAFHAEANRNRGFSHVPDEEKYHARYHAIKIKRDGQKPTEKEVVESLKSDEEGYERSFTNYYKEPKSNNYRSIHFHTMRNVAYEEEVKDPATGEIGKITKTRSTRLEIQIVGVLTHSNNTRGTAAHGKHYKGLPDQPDATAPYTVTAFTADNGILMQSRGASAIDFVAMQQGPDAALSSNSVIVKRHPSNWFDPFLYPDKISFKKGNPSLIEGHGTEVRTGDTIMSSTTPELLRNAEHMQHVVDASRDPRTKAELARRRKELLAIPYEGASVARPEDGNAPQSETSTPVI